jgi:adenine-specific DNA-methyltransferase
MKNYTKVNLTSSDLSLEKQEELRRILPEAFSEDKIDWEKLRTVLGDSVDERIEKFNFSWAGKSNAIKSVLIPSKGTLGVAKEEGIKFDESENIFIEGDNLEVLKLLQKAYFEKVKMIYIDPPYNTGGDFVYRDNFAAPLKSYLQQTGQVDSEGNKLQTNKETSGRFHSDWLSMMYPRLKLAWNLLKDDGVIFASIDDNEAHRLRMIMDEVFGEENFVGQFIWKSRQNVDSRSLTKVSTDHEYILCYTRNQETSLLGREIDKEKYKNPDNDPRGAWMSSSIDGVATADKRPNLHYEIVNPETGIAYMPNPSNGWRFEKKRIEKMISERQVIWPKNNDSKPRFKRYLNELGSHFTSLSSVLNVDFTQAGTRELRDIFGMETLKFPKPVSLIKFFLGQTNDDDIILDFFAGSGTTAHAVLKQNQEDGGNRKFILVQLPEATDVESEAYRAGYKTIADISKERIRRVINGYGENPQPIDAGFKVFKLGESNYPENQFEFDPEKSEEENKKAFEEYLTKAKQVSLFDEVNVSDVIYENIVKEGFSLNAKIAVSKIAENTVSIVSDGEMQFLICLDKKINEGAIRALTETEYKGKTFICFDSALDDTAKANLGLNIELKTI